MVAYSQRASVNEFQHSYTKSNCVLCCCLLFLLCFNLVARYKQPLIWSRKANDQLLLFFSLLFMAMLFYYLVTVGWRIFSATWTSLAHIWSRGSARCNQFGAHKIYCAKKKKLFRVLMSVSCDWHSVDGRGAVEYDTKHRCCKKINPLRMTYVCVRECFEATTTTSRQCQCDAIRRQVPFTYIKYVWNGNG